MLLPLPEIYYLTCAASSLLPEYFIRHCMSEEETTADYLTKLDRLLYNLQTTSTFTGGSLGR